MSIQKHFRGGKPRVNSVMDLKEFVCQEGGNMIIKLKCKEKVQKANDSSCYMWQYKDH